MAAARPSSPPGMLVAMLPPERARAKGELELEARVRIVERLPEQLAQARQPVANGLRVHVQRPQYP